MTDFRHKLGSLEDHVLGVEARILIQGDFNAIPHPDSRGKHILEIAWMQVNVSALRLRSKYFRCDFSVGITGVIDGVVVSSATLVDRRRHITFEIVDVISRHTVEADNGSLQVFHGENCRAAGGMP